LTAHILDGDLMHDAMDAVFARRHDVVVGALALACALSALTLAVRAPDGASRAQATPDSYATPAALDQPAGFGPAQLQAAYGLSTSPDAGAGQTIAIVDAFDDPDISTQLAAFDTAFDLPACAASCFTRVDQDGGTDYPQAAPADWSLEIAMDVEWAHAIAPGAHILLIEATTAGLADLLIAETYAGSHAGYVSNSWGYPEFAGETADAATFADPGVSYFAAVADSPNVTQYPATAPNVVAVGGDERTSSGAVPWTPGGGGCSAYEAATTGQVALANQAGCSGAQSTPAVSANAINIAVLGADSVWENTGGTSFATVLWAAAAADTGQVVTNAALVSGMIPLRGVLGGTLLKTGLGDLGVLPRSVGEFVNMGLAAIQPTI
jgi:subtilase family serine protease